MTPEFLNNEIFLELCKTLISCGLALLFFILFIATIGGVNNRDRYDQCPICGNNMSAGRKICRDCDFKTGD